LLPRAVVRARASSTEGRRCAIFRRPGAGPTRAAVPKGAVRPEHDHITDATVASAVAGVAATRPGAPLLFHRPSAVLSRAVIRAGAALRAGGVPSAAVPASCLRKLSSGQGHCLCPVTSAAVRRPRKWPARRRRFALQVEGVLVLPLAQRRALAGRCRPGRGSAPQLPKACHFLLARSRAPPGHHQSRAVRPEQDHRVVATITPVAARQPPELPARGRCFAPNDDLALPLARRRVHTGRRPGRSSSPFKRFLRRRDCHLRRRAPAA
jgi:hypothetical protein